MKKYLVLLCATVLFSSQGYANQTTTKQIEFMKKVYADRLNEDLMGVDIIKLHGSADLRQWIKKTDAIADANLGEMCEWVYEPMIPGNDSDVKMNQLKFSTLTNGLVRVQGKNFGRPFHIDYEVQCTTQGCKINDLFDPKSYKAFLKDVAKKGRC